MLCVRYCYCCCSWVSLMLCAYFSNAGFVAHIDPNKTRAADRASTGKWPIMTGRARGLLGSPGGHVSHGPTRSDSPSVHSGTMSEPRGSVPYDLTASHYGNSHETAQSQENGARVNHISVIYLRQRTGDEVIKAEHNRRETMTTIPSTANNGRNSESRMHDSQNLTEVPAVSSARPPRITPNPYENAISDFRRSLTFEDNHRLRTRRDNVFNRTKIAGARNSSHELTQSAVGMDSTTPEVDVAMTTASPTSLLLESPATPSAPTVQHRMISSSTSLKNKIREVDNLTEQATGDNKLQQDTRALTERPTEVSEVVSLGYKIEQNGPLSNLHVWLLLIATVGAVTLLLINLAGVLCCKRLLREKRPVSTAPLIDDLFPNGAPQRHPFLRRFSMPSTVRNDLRAASGLPFGATKHSFKGGVDSNKGRGRSNSAFSSRNYSTQFL